MKPKLLFLLLGGLCVAIAAAFGYALEGQAWPQGSNVTMQLALGSGQTLIDGSAGFNGSAEDALALWNDQLSRFQFSVVRNSTVSPSGGDGKNSVFFSNTAFGDSFGSTTLAVTIRRYPNNSNTLTEADVIFNNARSWNSYRGALRQAQNGGQLDDLHRVAIHEFGHVLGLDHPDEANQNVVAIMNSFESNTDSLQPDDIKGGQYLYGAHAPTATPTPAPAAADNLVNLSTRGAVGTNQNLLIGGFIVQGVHQSSLAIRALGPSLANAGIANSLSDPSLEVRDASGNLVASNDDWNSDATAAQALRSKGLAPSDARESALLTNLNGGSYTAIVSGYGGATGVGLLELYDLQGTDARIGNIATRELVQTGDRVLIAGFIIGGDKDKQVVVRALGPSLASRGINGALTNPVLELRDSSGNIMATNDDWRNGANAPEIQAAGLAPTDERESALMATLKPGSYTTVVRGYNGLTGIGVAEVYDMSPPPNQ